jgi:hypothetical protein
MKNVFGIDPADTQEQVRQTETFANGAWGGLFAIPKLIDQGINYGSNKLAQFGDWARANGLPGGQSMTISDAEEAQRHNALGDKWDGYRDVPFTDSYNLYKQGLKEQNPKADLIGSVVSAGGPIKKSVQSMYQAGPNIADAFKFGSTVTKPEGVSYASQDRE